VGPEKSLPVIRESVSISKKVACKRKVFSRLRNLTVRSALVEVVVYFVRVLLVFGFEFVLASRPISAGQYV
jgi:hypothetical protein